MMTEEECDIFVALLSGTVKRYLDKGEVYSASMLVNSPEVKHIISDPDLVSGITEDFILPYLEKFEKDYVEELKAAIFSLDINSDMLLEYNNMVMTYNSYVSLCLAFQFSMSRDKLVEIYDKIKNLHSAILYLFQEPSNPPRVGGYSYNKPDDDLPF